MSAGDFVPGAGEDEPPLTERGALVPDGFEELFVMARTDTDGRGGGMVRGRCAAFVRVVVRAAGAALMA